MTFIKSEGYCAYFYQNSQAINDSMSSLNYAIETSLYLVVMNGNEEFVKILMKNKNFDINFKK